MEYAYVGSYTSRKRGGLEYGGISVFQRAASDQPWKEVQVLEQFNPSFLTFGKDRTILYCVHADERYVSAFRINPENGKLTFINQRKTGFNNGVYLETDQNSNFLIVSSTSPNGSAMISIRIKEDGSLGEICDIEMPSGKCGPLKDIQNHPKAHQATFDRENKFLLEVDKGLDAVNSYILDSEGKMHLEHTLPCRMSSCPRHIAFHPNHQYAYLLTEWGGTVVFCHYDNGMLFPIEILPSVPSTYVGVRNTGAEIEVHPNGKFLYASNRGHNSIAAFQIGKDGRLSIIGWYTEGVDKPRHFKINDAGTELYCANEQGHSVSRFSIDPQSGELAFLDITMKASAPACIILNG